MGTLRSGRITRSGRNRPPAALFLRGNTPRHGNGEEFDMQEQENTPREIYFSTDLRDSLRVGKLARKLGVSRAQALGHVVCLWSSAAKYLDDGNLLEAGLEVEDIAEMGCCPADRAEEFSLALEEAEFVLEGVVHDWDFVVRDAQIYG